MQIKALLRRLPWACINTTIQNQAHQSVFPCCCFKREPSSQKGPWTGNGSGGAGPQSWARCLLHQGSPSLGHGEREKLLRKLKKWFWCWMVCLIAPCEEWSGFWKNKDATSGQASTTAIGVENGCDAGGLVLWTPFYTSEVVRVGHIGNRRDGEVLGTTSMGALNPFRSKLWPSGNWWNGKRRGLHCVNMKKLCPLAMPGKNKRCT